MSSEPKRPKATGGRPSSARKGRRRPSADQPRRAAYDTLRFVHADDAYANLVLPRLLRERGITDRDATFATELAYGTLRWSGTYDLVLARCVDRPLAAVDPPVLDVLRLGCHQQLGMRVPPHAATAATVDLAREVVGPGRAGFVNAVLRRVAGREREDWLTEITPDANADPVGSLAVCRGHPRWVVEAFADALGADPMSGDGRTELGALLDADNTPAAVTLVARPGRAGPDNLVAVGAGPGRWSPLAGTLAGGDPGALEVVRSGAVGAQDEGSQLAALVAAAAPLDGGADERWLDLCAGPGGKTALLAGLAVDRGATVTANELQSHRAELVRRAVTGAPGRPVEVTVADGRAGPWADSSFDRVLVDAPCSGLGALRRRPEARWRRTPDDVTTLVSLQRELLAAALAAVRPGGVVAYVTCSPVLAETSGVVGHLLAARADLEVLGAGPVLDSVATRPVPDARAVVGVGEEHPFVQLWPHRHGTDAMFVALLRRT